MRRATVVLTRRGLGRGGQLESVAPGKPLGRPQCRRGWDHGDASQSHLGPGSAPPSVTSVPSIHRGQKGQENSLPKTTRGHSGCQQMDGPLLRGGAAFRRRAACPAGLGISGHQPVTLPPRTQRSHPSLGHTAACAVAAGPQGLLCPPVPATGPLEYLAWFPLPLETVLFYILKSI